MTGDDDIPAWIIQHIKDREGWDTGHWDGPGRWAVGYGTVGTPGEQISRDEAHARLMRELQGPWGTIQKTYGTAPESVRGALLSTAYNAGQGSLRALDPYLRSSDYAGAAQRLRTLALTMQGSPDRSPVAGLVNRRAADAVLIDPDTASGSYAKASSASPQPVRISEPAQQEPPSSQPTAMPRFEISKTSPDVVSPFAEAETARRKHLSDMMAASHQSALAQVPQQRKRRPVDVSALFGLSPFAADGGVNG